LPSTHHSELWTAKEVEKHIIDIDALRTCEAVLLPEKFSSPPPNKKKMNFVNPKLSSTSNLQLISLLQLQKNNLPKQCLLPDSSFSWAHPLVCLQI